MPDLFSILSWSASSLSAQTARTATANHNLANVNTEGYARQRADLEATVPAELYGPFAIGRGSRLAGVSQARDPLVEHQLANSLGSSARSDAQAKALSGLTALDPDGGAGLVNALDGFYASLRQLGQAPGDLGSRQAVAGAAQQVGLAFNRTSQNITSARTGLDTDLAAKVARVNQLSQSMATLNNQVRIESATGGSPNDLLDARQKVQDELISLTGAVPVPDSDGNISLMLPNGGPSLVFGDQASTLSTQPDVTNGNHLALLLAPPDGSPAGVVPTGRFGGAMGGLFDARDGALKTAETSVDALAFDWATAVNTQHQAGFGLDGVSGRDLFVLSATSAGAARAVAVQASVIADPRQLAAASAAGAPGDASNLFNVIATETSALSSGQDVFDTLAAAIAGYGAAANGAQLASLRDGAVKDQLISLRESTSGVSIDEEMVALTQAQRGYEAVLKVIKTTDEMLETLMNLT